MPFKPRRPAGGFRVIYEYANRLSLLGYSVHLTYPLKTQFMKYRFPYWIRVLMAYIEGFGTNKWFSFNPAITMSYVPSIEDRYMPDADVVLVTWWATALEVGKLSDRKGKKINLIQGFEDWEGHKELLYSSYDMHGTVNVVVASYLKDMVSKYTNNRTVLIANGIDSKKFHISAPVEKRNRASVCMVYSLQKIKGSEYGVEALKIVKRRLPELEVRLFGICPAPKGLPEWMSYQREPADLCGFYNNNAIFISNSLTEGFGLVSVEAMLCGCALACTDIAGHKEYAINGETALLAEPENPSDMAEKVIELIENGSKRIALALNGNSYAQQFSWDIAVEKMDTLIKEITQ
jgi:glycosyltransferase involved in cell wall biosynthesis